MEKKLDPKDFMFTNLVGETLVKHHGTIDGYE